MDVNETLARCRELAQSLLQDPDSFSLADAPELAESFVALDNWLVSGGFPPNDWKREV